MKEWYLQIYCFNGVSGEKYWGYFEDSERDMIHITEPMTLNTGVKELIRVYTYLNKALQMQLYNPLTKEAIPIESLGI